MATGESGRILAVHNPVCSEPKEAAGVLSWLRDSQWGSGLEVVTTQDPATHDNVQLIQDVLQPDDTVICLGGDGLANDAFNATKRMIDAGQLGRDEVSLVPIPAGNGNDLTKSLYGSGLLRGNRLQNLLERREALLLDGMKIDSSSGLDKFVHSYIGLGFTGRAADFINQPDFRARRRDSYFPGKFLDSQRILKALWGLEPFEYANGSGQTTQAKEKIYALMPRIAAGVIKIDTAPFDREIIELELGARAFVLNALAVIGLQRFDRGAKGKTVDGPQELTLRTDTPLQYDGEPTELPAGTVLTISHHPESLRVLV
jgi:hypothetical protein